MFKVVLEDANGSSTILATALNWSDAVDLWSVMEMNKKQGDLISIINENA